MKPNKRILWPAVAGLALVGLAAWAAVYFAPARVVGLEPALLADGGGVRVVRDRDGLAFIPEGVASSGFIFYVGARIPPEAYAAMLRPLAESGIAVFVPRLPLNFAIFSVNRAKAIMEAHPDIGSWAVGGHSLGGASAALFLDKHRDLAGRVVFVASYPPESVDLSGWPGRFLSVYASNDLLATPEQAGPSPGLTLRLPSGSFVPIEGGNHAGFGYYGAQKGDGLSLISRDEQQGLAAGAMLEFLSGDGGD